MKRYLYIYLNIVSSTIKSMMSYRLNFFVQLFYGPAYVLIMYLILQLTFEHTTTLSGWSKEEAKLLFSVFHLLGTIGLLIYMQGIRHFVWSGLRLGELDLLLTKPVNAQFMVSIARPSIEQIGLFIGIALLFAKQISILSIPIFSSNFLLFLLLFICGTLIAYFSISTYAALGFFVVKAQQVIEMYDKVSDFSQYPIPIFPKTIIGLAFSIVPIAFFGYVPTMFLLGKGTSTLLLITITVLTITLLINRFAWKKGLESYSSASS